MTNPFTKHPRDIGETYFEHFRAASSFGFRMITGGLACMVHGIFPFMFEKTGSKKIRHLHDKMVLNRRKADSLEPCMASDMKNPHARFTHTVFSEL